MTRLPQNCDGTVMTSVSLQCPLQQCDEPFCVTTILYSKVYTLFLMCYAILCHSVHCWNSMKYLRTIQKMKNGLIGYILG